MFAPWIQIAELALLPLGFVLGLGVGRISRREEHLSFQRAVPAARPGPVPSYPAPFLMSAPSSRRGADVLR